MVGVSPERLLEFRSGAVDLRDLTVETRSEEWYVASENPTTEEFDLELQSSPLWTSPYLPEAGYKLNAATSGDVTVLAAGRAARRASDEVAAVRLASQTRSADSPPPQH